MTAALREQLSSARRALRTVPGDPLDARRRLAASLRQLADADLSCSYQILADRDGWRLWMPPAISGSAAVARAWISQGSGKPFTPAFDPELPPAGQVGRFRSLVAQYRHTSIYRDFYRPFGFEQQLRSLFYDGSRFLGWVGVLRSADRPRFSRAVRAALDALAPDIQRFLQAIDGQERAAIAGVTPAHLVLSSTGELLHATEGLQPWLDRRRRRDLSAYVTAFDAGRVSAPGVIDGVDVSCVRLVGDATVYLLTLDAAPRATRSALASLSPRRRRIAGAAAEGATCREIAESLAISPHTVRQHLKEIYRQLQVTSRVELAQRLDAA